MSICIILWIGFRQNDKIAEVTGDNINTVKSRLYKALKLLKLDLEVYDEV